ELGWTKTKKLHNNNVYVVYDSLVKTDLIGIAWSHNKNVIVIKNLYLDEDHELVQTYLENYESDLALADDSIIIPKDIDPTETIGTVELKSIVSFKDKIEDYGYYYWSYPGFSATVNIIDRTELDLNLLGQELNIPNLAEDIKILNLSENYYYHYSDPPIYHNFWYHNDKIFYIKFYSSRYMHRYDKTENKILDMYFDFFPSEIEKQAEKEPVKFELEEIEEEIEEEQIEEEPIPDEESAVFYFDIEVMDTVLEKPVQYALIYVNNNFEGLTDSKGIFKGRIKKKPSEEIKIRIEKKGYETKQTKITNQDAITINLKLRYDVFDIPEGYEKYVNRNKIFAWIKKRISVVQDYVDIHPQENKLRSYSYPIITEDKLEALQTLIKKVRDKENPLMTYDHNCYPYMLPGCDAWHKSDYDILEAKEGVCADYSTLAVSFGNSYNIPTRQIRAVWKEDSLLSFLGIYSRGRHAFAESYIPGKGWVHFDIGWGIYNYPCIYSKGALCVESAVAEYGTDNEENVIEKYACGKICSEEEIDEEASREMPPAEAQVQQKELIFDIVENKVKFSYKEIFNEEASKKLLELYEEGAIDKTEAGNYLLRKIKENFRQKVDIENTKFIFNKDDEINIKIGISFEFEIDKSLTYNIDAFTDLYHVVVRADDIEAILPIYDKKQENTYYFIFDDIGNYDLTIIREHEDSLAISGSPNEDALAEVLSSHINSEWTSWTEDTKISSAGIKRIFIIGDTVPVEIENSLKAAGKEIYRFNGLIYASAGIAEAFWLSSEEAAVANVYDFDSVEQSKEYAIENDIPLIYIESDNIPNIVDTAVENLGVEKLTVKDPNEFIEIKSKKGNIGLIIFIVFIFMIILGSVLAYFFIAQKKSKKK
ncbi:transglutaminase-like domain-containing protein, partial [Candidatus Woesearchaeota archaeon]|nr:transglutaminase-like domain-containing protein [Candidatus Woesearchaeota archaeon]